MKTDRSINLARLTTLSTAAAAVLLALSGSAALGATDGAGTGAAAAVQPAAIGSYLVVLEAPSVADTLRASRAEDGEKWLAQPAPDLAAIARANPDQARAAERLARAEQVPVLDAARDLGATVVARYTAAANGLLVHASSEQMRRLAHVAGVVRVEPAPRVRLALAHSVPYIGATRVHQELGYDGEGTVVAVVDTGIDYTHADFGGPGSTTAFQAAIADTVGIDDEFAGLRLFPTAKVVGGWDFVGQRYNPPWLCSPDQEAAGTCTTTPEPDADPLDQWGHGTHVAGIAAGLGTPSGSIGPGVAPGAGLVALKIYSHHSGVDEEVDVLVDAIEWCTRVNLGLQVPGTPPPSGRIDVINMSLGEPFGQASAFFDQAVEAATESGITVVASAGNEQDVPFIAGAPSTSPRVLSVASSTAPSDSYRADFAWEGGSSSAVGSEGTATRSLADAGRVEGELANMGLACNGGDWSTDPPAGKFALIERGTCTLGEKVLNAQAQGATGIIMFTDHRARIGISGGVDEPQLPGLMIDRDPGLELVALLADGVTVSAVMDPASLTLDTSRADAISNFSSRGPSKHGTLKPDVTAPGSSIVSAGVGKGDGGSSLSGTSMSSPHAAGAAAVLRNRSNSEALGLGGADVAALLMNSAVPVITDTGAGGTLRPVTRQGAGRIDLVRAAAAPLLVRSWPLASLYAGPLTTDGIATASFAVTVRNLGDSEARLAPSAFFRNDAGEAAIRLRYPDPITIAGGAERTLLLQMDIDGAALPDWPYGTTAGVSASAADEVELDGWLEFFQLDREAQPVADAVNPRLPFTVLARRESDITSIGVPPTDWRPDPPDEPQLTLTNRSVYPGRAELYWHAGEDQDEPDVMGELDIRHVGVRITGPRADITRTMLSFAISTWEPLATPFSTRFEIFVDTDQDGRADKRVRMAPMTELGGNESTVIGVAAALYDPGTGAIAGEAVVGRAAADIETRVVVAELPIETLSMMEPGPIAFSVRQSAAALSGRNANEDWLGEVQQDLAPDLGALYTFDPEAVPWRITTWGADIPGRSSVGIPLEATDSAAPAGLMGVFPQNSPAEADAQAFRFEEGVIPPPESSTLYLPALYRSFEINPPGPDEQVAAAIDSLAATGRFRMTFDDFIAADPGGSALREHEFDHDHGVDVVTRPKIGADIWQIRFRDKGYVHVTGVTWRCGPIEWYMFLRPDLIARLRSAFPTNGWQADGRSRVDPSLLQFRYVDQRAGITYLAQLPEFGGPVVLLSRTVGEVVNPTESQIYRFRDFNSSDILVGAPRGTNCDR